MITNLDSDTFNKSDFPEADPKDSYHIAELAAIFKESEDCDGFTAAARFLYRPLQAYFNSKQPTTDLDKVNEAYHKLKADYEGQSELLNKLDKTLVETENELDTATEKIEGLEESGKQMHEKLHTTELTNYQNLDVIEELKEEKENLFALSCKREKQLDALIGVMYIAAKREEACMPS